MKIIKPLISVIVPNYNHEKFLRQRLTSIFDQSFKDFEVILMDDSSIDNSLEILNYFSSHTQVSCYIKNEQNSGSPFKQWYKGIKQAKGEYIWIAESDDFCSLNFLEKIIHFKDECGMNPGIIYSQSIEIDENGKYKQNRIDVTSRFNPNIWEKNFCIGGYNFIEKYFTNHNVIPNASAAVFRRDLVTSEVFLNQLLNMKMCGDWLFWIKLCSKTQVAFVSEPLNFFRIHESSTRLHGNRKLKEQRLLEEAVVRKHLKNSFGLKQQVEIRKLYTSWIALQSAKDLLNKKSHRIIVDKYSYFTFLMKYLQNHLNGK